MITKQGKREKINLLVKVVSKVHLAPPPHPELFHHTVALFYIQMYLSLITTYF